MIKKYRVHDLVKFDYSEIQEYIDENHTDRPLRNDIVVDLLNQLSEENEQLIDALNQKTEQCDKYYKENKQLKSELGEKDIQLDFLKAENKHMSELVNENGQLKKSNERFSKTVAEQIIMIKEYREENEQLKETNQELYDFRLVLNALLFNEWAETGKYEVYKSKRHHDGEPCFDGEWFIVVAILPSGQVTNHYHIKYWDYFKIPSYERVKDEFDGHTSSVVLLRYGVLLE